MLSHCIVDLRAHVTVIGDGALHISLADDGKLVLASNDSATASTVGIKTVSQSALP